ncbi:hypothetical protein [Corallibacter sp.]|uniref:hypothetical protein n=1 Tax=Corallibacter sp. TaxID=2038084 RepID=UPI003AB4B5CF
MKLLKSCILFVLISQYTIAQIGIGNTNPNAQLDISAGTIASEKDGLLIPRLDEYPTGVGANQNGMLVFITGNGAPTKGFYYWDNDAMNWISFGASNVEKIDDLIDGKSDSTGSSVFLGFGAGSNDDGSNNQNVGIGFEALNNNTDGFWNIGIGYGSLYTNTSGDGNIAMGWLSLRNNTLGFANLALGHQSLNLNTTGDYNTAIGTYALLKNENGSLNLAVGSYSSAENTSGSYNTIIGNDAGRFSYGSSNVFLGYRSGYYETGNNKLYIENNAADSDSALIYGEFDNNILRTNSEFQIRNPSSNGYAFPLIDGTSNQVLSTDGNGQLTFVNINSLFTDNDNQTIDNFNLNGTTLELSIENDGEVDQTVDLSSLNTDNQTIDNFNLNGTTLEISLENDGETNQTVDLSSLQSPNISNFSLARITLSANQTISNTGYTKLNFGNIDFDINADFDTINDEFIAPTNGYYRVNTVCRTYGVSSGTYLYGLAIYVNGTRVRLKRYNQTGTANFVRTLDNVLALNAGDTLDVRFYNVSPSISITSGSQETALVIERIR